MKTQLHIKGEILSRIAMRDPIRIRTIEGYFSPEGDSQTTHETGWECWWYDVPLRVLIHPNLTLREAAAILHKAAAELDEQNESATAEAVAFAEKALASAKKCSVEIGETFHPREEPPDDELPF